MLFTKAASLNYMSLFVALGAAGWTNTFKILGLHTGETEEKKQENPKSFNLF